MSAFLSLARPWLDFPGALGLAGMELHSCLCSIVTSCFEFVAKTVLLTHYSLAIADQCLHSTKAFSFSHSGPAGRVGWECGTTRRGHSPVS